MTLNIDYKSIDLDLLNELRAELDVQPLFNFYQVSKDGSMIIVRDGDGLYLPPELAGRIVAGLIQFYSAVSPEVIEMLNNDIECRRFHAKRDKEKAQRELEQKRYLENREKAEQKVNQEKPGYVYVIESENGYFKIGRTNDLQRRLRQHQGNYPFKLKYIITYYFEDCIAAERYYLDLFAEKKVMGEWFQLTQDDLETIKESVKDTDEEEELEDEEEEIHNPDPNKPAICILPLEEDLEIPY